MAVEDDQSVKLTVEDEPTDVELESVPAVADDDEVEAHFWRAQS